MHPLLSEFVARECVRDPARYTPIRDFCREFIAGLPETERPGNWPRGRIIAELARGGLIIARTSQKASVIVGLGLRNPAPFRIDEKNGKLVRT